MADLDNLEIFLTCARIDYKKDCDYNCTPEVMLTIGNIVKIEFNLDGAYLSGLEGGKDD